MNIKQVRAREVLDSRGKPTVEAEVEVDGGVVGRAIVPSGASTGHAEAHELRDGDPQRYDGQGVLKAVAHVNQSLGPAVLSMDSGDQQAVDARLIELDGTPQKSRLGANALLAVSMATARAAALARSVPLYRHLHELLLRVGEPVDLPDARMPLVMTNMISGGAHANRNLDIQDVLIVPFVDGYANQLETIVRVYRRLGELLRSKGYEGYLVGDEGGYGPRLKSNREAIELVLLAIERSGLKSGADVAIALDVAATQFFREGRYHLAVDGQSLDSAGMIELLCEWVRDYPICSIEDGLADEDWPAWQGLTHRLRERTALVGDDLFTTNPARLRKGIEGQVATSVLIKMNQIGTLSETLETIATARRNAYAYVVSARSGETEDDTMADLAVASAATYIKIGSIVRSERLAKYNRLLRIVDELRAGH